jgi:bifunctional DNase/RNase
MVEVKIEFLTIDQNTNTPVVVLKEKEGDSKRILLIWIGRPEAWAIEAWLKKESMQRPMTHDLFKNVIDAISGKVNSICINAVEKSTFYAQVRLELNGQEFDIDSRPSDALALAIRCEAPIYVEEEVIEENGFLEAEVKKGKPTPRDAKDVLENLDDEIVKHYTV